MKNRLTKAIIGLLLAMFSTFVLIWMYHGVMLNEQMQGTKAYTFFSENEMVFSGGTFVLHVLAIVGLIMLFFNGIRAFKERKG